MSGDPGDMVPLGDGGEKESGGGDRALHKRKRPKRSLSFSRKKSSDAVGQDGMNESGEKEESRERKKKRKKREKRAKKEKREKPERSRKRKRSKSLSRRHSKQEEEDEIPPRRVPLVKDFSSASKVQLVNELYREEEARSYTARVESSTSPEKKESAARSFVRSLSSNLLPPGRRAKPAAKDGGDGRVLHRSNSASLAAEVSSIGAPPVPTAPVRRRNSMEELANMDVPQPFKSKAKKNLGSLVDQEDEAASPRIVRCGGSVLKLYKGDMLDDDCDSLDTIRGRGNEVEAKISAGEAEAPVLDPKSGSALFSPRNIANMLSQSKKGGKKVPRDRREGKEKADKKKKKSKKKRSGEGHSIKKKKSRSRKSSRDENAASAFPRSQTEVMGKQASEELIVSSSLPAVVLAKLPADVSTVDRTEDSVDVAPAPQDSHDIASSSTGDALAISSPGPAPNCSESPLELQSPLEASASSEAGDPLTLADVLELTDSVSTPPHPKLDEGCPDTMAEANEGPAGPQVASSTPSDADGQRAAQEAKAALQKMLEEAEDVIGGLEVELPSVGGEGEELLESAEAEEAAREEALSGKAGTSDEPAAVLASPLEQDIQPRARVRSNTTTTAPTYLAAQDAIEENRSDPSATEAKPQRARSVLTTAEQSAIAELLAAVDAVDTQKAVGKAAHSRASETETPSRAAEALEEGLEDGSEEKKGETREEKREEREEKREGRKEKGEPREEKGGRSSSESRWAVEDLSKDAEASLAVGAEGVSDIPDDAMVRKGRSPLQATPDGRQWRRSKSTPAQIPCPDVGPPPVEVPEVAPSSTGLSRIPKATLEAEPSRSKSWGFTSEEDKIGGDGMEETLKFLKRDQQQLSLIKSKKKERPSSPFEVFRKKRRAKKAPTESKMLGKCSVPVTLCNGVEVVVAADTVDGGKSVLADDLLRDTVAALERQGVEPSPIGTPGAEAGAEPWQRYELSYRLVEIGDLSKGALLNPLKQTKKGERIFLRDKSFRPQFVFKTPSQREFNPFNELKEKQEKMKDIESAFEAWSKGKPKRRKAPGADAPVPKPQPSSDIVVLGSWSVTAPQISTELGQELSKAGHKFYDHVKPRGKRDSFSTTSFTVKGRGSPSEETSASVAEDDSSDWHEDSSDVRNTALKNTVKRKKLVKRVPVGGVFDGAEQEAPSASRSPLTSTDLAKKERRPAPARRKTALEPATTTPVSLRARSYDVSGVGKQEETGAARTLEAGRGVEERRRDRSPARLSPALRRTESAMVRVASDDGTEARRLRSFLDMERESLRNATRVRRSFGEEGDPDDLLAASMPIAPVQPLDPSRPSRNASMALPISKILATSHNRNSRKSVFEVLERKSSHDGSASSYDELAPSPRRHRSKSVLPHKSDSLESSDGEDQREKGLKREEIGSFEDAEGKRDEKLPEENAGDTVERRKSRDREERPRLRVSIEKAAGEARWEEEDGSRQMVAGQPSHILEHVLQAPSLEEAALVYLSTLRYFSDEEWLLQQLCARFRALWKKSSTRPSQAESLSLLDLLTEEYERDKYLGCMKKIVRVIELWTNVSFLAFHQRKALGPLLDDLIAFAEAEIPSGTAMMENISRCAKSSFVGPVLDFAPMPLLPVGFVDGKPTEDISVIVYDPVEVARQLTLMDFRMVSKLTVNDLFDSAWQGSKRLENAPNLVPYTERFNHVTFWVVTEILMAWNSHERVKKIEWFIRLTEELFVLHNFNSVMAVLSGVSMNVVERLKETWRRVQPELHDTLQTIAYVMQSIGNFKNYRAKLKSITPPFIPFQALVCGDLTRACTGMPSYLEDGLVNVGKLREIAKILRLVQVCQENPYGFYEVPVICDQIVGAKVIQDDDELYRLSTACEAAPAGLQESV